jgi:hypothetical protein
MPRSRLPRPDDWHDGDDPPRPNHRSELAERLDPLERAMPEDDDVCEANPPAEAPRVDDLARRAVEEVNRTRGPEPTRSLLLGFVSFVDPMALAALGHTKPAGVA